MAWSKQQATVVVVVVVVVVASSAPSLPRYRLLQACRLHHEGPGRRGNHLPPPWGDPWSRSTEAIYGIDPAASCL